MFYPLSHIYVKTPFRCVETAANNSLNRRHVVVFDQLWANAAPTLNTTFSLTNFHPKWWIHRLPISSIRLLSHATSIYHRPKRVCFCFVCVCVCVCVCMCVCVCVVFQDNCRIWTTLAFSIICKCTTAFRVSIPLLNRCFRRNRVRITLIKPLLCLNSIFSQQKAMLYQHAKFRFLYCFENLQQQLHLNNCNL